MNNCPKCGNPLQAGTASCPICGTNLSMDGNANVLQQPAEAPIVQGGVNSNLQASNTPVNSVSSPLSASTSSNVVTPTVNTSVVGSSQTVNSNSNVTPDVLNVSPVVAEFKPTVETLQPVVPNPASVMPTSVVSGSNNEHLMPNVDIPQAPVTPTVVNNGSQIPDMSSMSIPTSGVALPTVNAPTDLTNDITQINNNKGKTLTKKKKFGKLFVLLLILGVAVAGVTVYMKLPIQSLTTNNTKKVEEPTIVTKSVSTNGYKFEMYDGWYTIEDGNDVIVVNAADSISVYLFNLNYDFSTVSDDNLISFFSNNDIFSDVKIDNGDLGSKKSKIATMKTNTNNKNMPIEYYYIDGGENLTLGASVVYRTDEACNNFREDVKKMLSTLSYSNDVVKALNKKTEFNTYFSAGERAYTTYGSSLNITKME